MPFLNLNWSFFIFWICVATTFQHTPRCVSYSERIFYFLFRNVSPLDQEIISYQSMWRSKAPVGICAIIWPGTFNKNTGQIFLKLVYMSPSSGPHDCSLPWQPRPWGQRPPPAGEGKVHPGCVRRQLGRVGRGWLALTACSPRYVEVLHFFDPSLQVV